MSKDKKNVNKKSIEELEEWSEECEKLLAEWSEKASCYRWLHARSEKNYRRWYYCFSIPVIILSTLTGAANVGMDSFVPAENKSMASAIVGGVNIFAGIISTLQNFLKVAELMEGHRIAGVSWGKLQRNISIELALDPSRRIIQTDFLKMSRSEYDRLIEAGPIIDDGIIKEFKKKFKNYDVAVPSVCNGLDKCEIFKINKNIKPNEKIFKEGVEDIISKQDNSINELNDIKTDKRYLEKDINQSVNDNNLENDNIINNESVNDNNFENDNIIINNESVNDNIIIDNNNDNEKITDNNIVNDENTSKKSVDENSNTVNSNTENNNSENNNDKCICKNIKNKEEDLIPKLTEEIIEEIITEETSDDNSEKNNFLDGIH